MAIARMVPLALLIVLAGCPSTPEPPVEEPPPLTDAENQALDEYGAALKMLAAEAIALADNVIGEGAHTDADRQLLNDLSTRATALSAKLARLRKGTETYGRVVPSLDPMGDAKFKADATAGLDENGGQERFGEFKQLAADLLAALRQDQG